jgi:DNA-binding CsgD family transcriptional regulator
MSEKHNPGERSGPPATEQRLRLLEVGEQLAKLGSWEWLPGEDALSWSDNHYRILGLEPGVLTPTPEFMLEHVHPLDRDRMARYLDMSRTVRDLPPIEYRILLEGHGIRYLRTTITQIEINDRGATRIVGVVQDITDERMAAQEIAAHVAVSSTLSEWEDFDSSADRLLRTLGEACEFALGVLWTPQDDALVPRARWTKPGLAVADFEDATFAASLSRGEGLPGRAWESMHPETVVDVTEDPWYLPREAARAAGLHSALAFPAVKATEVLAVLEFYSQHEDLSDRLGKTMSAIGYELGEFLSRRRGELQPPVLTPRQIEVLQLATEGQTVAQIAEALQIGPGTAKTHLENIYRKLGVSDRSAAVAYALRLGLIE